LNSYEPDVEKCISDPRPIVEMIGEAIARKFYL
jgi:hypothetical protein